jgi:hypothetical protein
MKGDCENSLLTNLSTLALNLLSISLVLWDLKHRIT